MSIINNMGQRACFFLVFLFFISVSSFAERGERAPSRAAPVRSEKMGGRVFDNDLGGWVENGDLFAYQLELDVNLEKLKCRAGELLCPHFETLEETDRDHARSKMQKFCENPKSLKIECQCNTTGTANGGYVFENSTSVQGQPEVRTVKLIFYKRKLGSNGKPDIFIPPKREFVESCSMM